MKGFNLAPDEAYYWDWSRNLSFSYYSHPPMVAYIIRIFTFLGQDSAFWVRLPAVLFTVGVSILIYLLTRDIFKSERTACLSVLLLNIIPGFTVGAFIITPDAPLIFFWALSLYFFHKISVGTRGPWWYLVGITTGLGLLSKYTMVLFYPCALLFLLLSKENRGWLKRKEPYLALLLAVLLFTPVLIWNYQHEWVSFSKQFTHGLAKKGYAFHNLGEYVGSQAGIISPFLFLGFFWATIKGLRRGVNERKDSLLFLVCFFLPVFFLFFVTSLLAPVEANWPAVAYLAAIVLLGGFLFTEEKVNRKFPLALFIFVTTFFFTTLAYSLPLLPTRIKPINELYGWKELGAEVNAIRKDYSNEIFIFSSHHQIASEVAFYTQAKQPIYEIDSQYGKDYWGNIDFLKGRDALFVVRSDYDELPFVGYHFISLEKTRDIPIFRKGEKIKTFSVYYCHNYLGGLFDD
jgi:undecaprenyl-diphosphatase